VVLGADVSPEAEMLLAALPADGSRVGGLQLRSSLDLDKDTFARAKQELSVADLVVVGPGQGGTVARVSPKVEPTRRERPSRLLAWLRRHWDELSVKVIAGVISGVVLLVVGALASLLAIDRAGGLEPGETPAENRPLAPRTRDSDRDRDGTPDSTDACPDEPADTPNGCPSPPPSPPDESDTLSDLKRMGDAPEIDDIEGDYGQQEIGGESYEHGISMLVYLEDPDDDSGIPELTLETDGRYTRMSGYVGIQDEESDECSGAEVSITNESGKRLWPRGGRRVEVHGEDPDPVRFSFRMERPEQVKLVQKSLAESPDDGCNGSANPAWGEVRFTKGSAGAGV